MIIFEL